MTRTIRARIGAAALALAHVSCASGPGSPIPEGAAGGTSGGPGPQSLAVGADRVTGPPAPSERQTALGEGPAVRLAAAGAAQRDLDRAIESWFQGHGTQRTYVMLDKPLYQPGEVIWFRGDVRTSATLLPASVNATVRLIGPRGDIVAEKRIMAVGGVLANDFEIPFGVAGGEYALELRADSGLTDRRALTISTYEPPRFKKSIEMMKKAYGPGDTIAAAVEVARATGEPLAKKQLVGIVTVDDVEVVRVPVTTDEHGKATVRAKLPGQIARGDGLLTLIVDDGGLTESIQKRIPILLRSVDVQLFPEGGQLVAGLPGRVYVSAQNSMGKPADVEGTIVDDRGRRVAVFATVRDGLGKVELTPEAGRSYHLEVTRPVGIAQTFPLPAARAEGCGLTAVDDPASEHAGMRVAVACTAARSIVLEAVLRDKRIASGTVAVPAGAERIVELPVPDDAQGAVRVTIFGDKEKTPLAERLIYRGRGRDLKVTIEPDRPSYAPRDKVTLAVKTTDLAGRPVAASLGLSVVDDTVLSYADDKTAHLVTHLYLESELPGVAIEDPNFYFGTAPEAAVALDLVMGTKGWRRFDWQPVFAPSPATTTSVASGAEYDGHFAEGKARPPMEAPMAMAEPANVPDPAPPPQAPRPAPMKGRLAAQGAGKGVGGRGEARARGGEEQARNVGPMGGAMADLKEKAAKDERRNARGPGRAMAADDEWGGDRDAEVAWAPVRVFPVPDHKPGFDGPRTDFRETIFWAPEVKTGADGRATIAFPLSDAVTSFRVTAEGTSAAGLPGRGEAKVASKTPLSLVAKLPTEVSSGDRLELPLVITNETDRRVEGKLDVLLGKAFKLRAELPRTVALAARETRTIYASVEIVGDGKEAAEGKIALALVSAGLKDELERTVKVAPLGFPFEASFAGTTAGSNRHVIDLGGALPRSMTASVSLYPSPLATMTKGTEALLAEPGGCFEQTSATNYPNTMVLAYLAESDAASPETVSRAQDLLGKGYKILSGYETRDKGYEWFGEAPGHEALTAYGIMEFEDMAMVDDRVDRGMIDRTAAWLMTRRDGKGGFKRNERALDSFGRASADTTNGYIMWALSEAKRVKGLDAELARQKEIGLTSKDPYLVALAANVWLNVAPEQKHTDEIVARLVGMQDAKGGWSGAKQSITMSGGQSLDVETTSLAIFALTKLGAGEAHAAPPREGRSPLIDQEQPLRRGVDWLNGAREGGGAFGSTQGTVLTLKALAAYAKRSRQTPVGGTAIVRVNGQEVQRFTFAKGHRDAIVLDDLAHALRAGRNEIELVTEGGAKLPYSVAVSWRADRPVSDPDTVIDVTTRLDKTRAKVGEGVRLVARIENRSKDGVPMTLARIGLPGGLAAQTWQLKELKDKKSVDFVETRAREVIVYFRALPPGAVREVPLDLIAQLPGTTVAPASSGYLYYTDEHKDWAEPLQITVTR